MAAARKWGVKPHEWSLAPRWSRAMMVAQVETEMKVNWWMVEDAKRNT
jgi:hypothetical protein